MLTCSTIQRLIAANHADRLIKALCENGLALPLSMQIRLLDEPAAIWGLGLRRLCELSYGIGPDLRDLANSLACGGEVKQETDPVTKACVASGLLTCLTLPGGNQALWQNTAGQLLDDLLQQQASSGWFDSDRDKTIQDKQLTGCLIQFLLGRELEFQTRSQNRGTDLSGAIAREGDCLSSAAETLWIASACFTGFIDSYRENEMTCSPNISNASPPPLFTTAA